MTDELDLIGELSGAEPLRPQAYQRARAVLRAAMADPGTVRVLGPISMEDTTVETTPTIESTPVPDNGSAPAIRNRRKTRTAGRLGIGAGVGAAAAAAVIAVIVSSASTGSTTQPVAKSPGAGTAGTAATGASPAGGQLLTLAGSIKTNPPATGDAWLVVSTQVQGTKAMQTDYTLYTDSHKIYSGISVKTVKEAIARHQDQANSGGYAPVLKAAILAANSSPAEGRTRMLKAAGDPLVGLDPAAQKTVWDKQQAASQKIIKLKGGNAKPKPYSAQAVQRHFDNVLWAFSEEALSVGDGNSLVRQGVLRLLSTISAVDVARSTTNGTATLTITAGPEVFGGEGSEVLTVDAKTGMLIKSVSTMPGTSTGSTTYKSSRVTTAQL